jgi:hypothetical protein
MGKLLDNDIVRNLVPLIVVGLLLYALISAGKQPLWAEAYRRLRRNMVAVFAASIIGVYGLIAVLDSLGTTDKNRKRTSPSWTGSPDGSRSVPTPRRWRA